MKLLIAFASLWLSVGVFAQDVGIKFEHELSLEKSLEKAKKENKFVFVDCYTEWCGPCKKLSAEVFPNKEVGDYFNTNFINVKMDMEKGEGPEIGTRYKISGYPTLLILNSEGDIILKKVGYLNVTQLINVGKVAKSDPTPLSVIKKRIKEGDRSEAVVLKYIDANFSYRKPNEYSDLLDEYFTNLSGEQKYSQGAWDIFNAYQFNIYSKQFEFFANHRAAYENAFGEQAVKDKINGLFSMNAHGLEEDSKAYKDLKVIDVELFENYLALSGAYKALSECHKNKEDQELWLNFIEKLSVYAADKNVSVETLNNLCWIIYENREAMANDESMAKVKAWSYITVQADPKSHLYNDTYAHLCFEVGEISEAIKYQELAIEYAKRDKENAKWYEEELERYKKAL